MKKEILYPNAYTLFVHGTGVRDCDCGNAQCNCIPSGMPGVWFESENEKISPHYLNAQPDCVVLLAGQRHTTPHKTIKPGIVGHALKQIHSTGTKIVSPLLQVWMGSKK